MVLRNNAKRRGKFFDLTYEQFLEFLKKDAPNYMRKRGRTVKKLQIDRIDPDKGYTATNIQCITTLENIRKMHSDRIQKDLDDCPF